MLNLGDTQDLHMCIPLNLSSFYKSIWIPVLVHEAVLFSLALYKGFQNITDHGTKAALSRFTIFLVKDSIIYFVV